MNYIKEFVLCDKCGGDSNLYLVDFINRTSFYECISCSEKFEILSEEVYIHKKLVDFFYLKDTGEITYKCGVCGEKIIESLKSKNNDEQLVLLKNAYNGACGSCIDDNESKCLNCNEIIDFEERKYYVDNKSFEVFCEKNCYLDYIKCEYY